MPTSPDQTLTPPTAAPDAALPAAFVEVEPDTPLALPHIAIGPEWRPAMERFVELVPDMGPILKLNYGRPRADRVPEGADPADPFLPFVGKPETCTMHVRPEAIPDAGVRRELLHFAQALHAYDLPGDLDGAIVTQSMIGPAGGYGMKHLFAFLRAAMVDLGGGERLAAHVIETHGAGHDEIFPPHTDMWVTTMLLNVFNVQPAGQGVSTMVRMDDAWPAIAASGIPDEGLAQMRRAVDDAGVCDLYMQFNAWLYDDRPWSDDIAWTLSDLCLAHEMQPGQGYLVDDRKWLHGRLGLVWPERYTLEDKQNRLYRLGYDTKTSVEHAAARAADWERHGYFPQDCVGDEGLMA
ncbi:MAG: hypothetical protein AAGC46_02775 [Solirubrobacteraceae bacterium]